MSKARRRSKGSSQASRPKTAREQEITTKRRGELAELAFVLKAASLGFAVAKPYGDSERYDFIVDSGQTLSRVQVKSSSTLLNGLYRINAHRRTAHGVVPYDPSEIDFMAAYVIPDDAWFIIPIAVTSTRTSLLLCPPRLAARRRPLRRLSRSLAPDARTRWPHFLISTRDQIVTNELSSMDIIQK